MCESNSDDDVARGDCILGIVVGWGGRSDSRYPKSLVRLGIFCVSVWDSVFWSGIGMWEPGVGGLYDSLEEYAIDVSAKVVPVGLDISGFVRGVDPFVGL